MMIDEKMHRLDGVTKKLERLASTLDNASHQLPSRVGDDHVPTSTGPFWPDSNAKDNAEQERSSSADDMEPSLEEVAMDHVMAMDSQGRRR